MRALLRSAWLLFAALLLAGAANAQTTAVLPRDHDTTRGELRRADNFFDNHPEIARELRRHPRLVDNPQYVRNHPEFREFLATHPEVREEMRENPRAFMKRERKFDKREQKVDKRERKEDREERWERKHG